MHVGTSCTKSEQYLLAIQFMSTFRRAEEMQFQQFNQGEYLDVHNVKQVWNGPVAAAFDDNNRECPSGCARVIQNLFRLGNDDVCETFRKEVRAKIKIWKMALYHTKFRTGHSSYFWFLREREREREREIQPHQGNWRKMFQVPVNTQQMEHRRCPWISARL